VTGIAAALVLAIGLSTWNRDGGRLMQRDTSLMSAAGADARAPEGAQLEAVAPVAGTAPAAGREAPSGAANAPLRSQVGEAAVADFREPPAEKATARKIEVARGGAAGNLAARPPSAPAVPVDSVSIGRQATVASGPEGVARDTTRLRTTSSMRPTLLSEVVVTSAPKGLDSVTTLGAPRCYRLASAAEERGREEKSSTQRAAETTSGAAATSRAARTAPPAAAAAPQRDRMDYAAQRPAVVRLDTVRAGVGLRADDARSSSYLGTWERIGDSVRVSLLAHGVFTIAVRDSVSCP
jgi:hypothetical protein